MGVKGHFFPVYRRWTAFARKTPETYVQYPRHVLCKAPSSTLHSNTSNMSSSRSAFMRVHMISGELRRYHSSNSKGGGDDEREDMKERKSAVFRALKGSKAKNRKQKTTSNMNSPKSRMQKQQSQKNTTENTSNRSNSRTTTSATPKKLTLDEFFSNLEKQKVDDFSSQPSQKTGREKGVSEGEKSGKRLFHPQDGNAQKSHSAPAANMDSFFDEVNATMHQKEKERKQLQQTARNSTAQHSETLTSKPSFHASISDLIPPRSPISNDSAQDEDVGYNCTLESWDRYSELLDEVIEGPKFLARLQSKKSDDDTEMKVHVGQVVEWLRSRRPLVKTRLSTLDVTLAGEDAGTSDDLLNDAEKMRAGQKKSFRKELNAQKETFLEQTCWTRKQYEVATGALVAMGNLCAKNCIAQPLDVAWCKLKELGYPMNSKDVLHNYLYVASTFSLPTRRSSLPGEGIDDNGREADGSLSVLEFLSGNYGLSSTFSSDTLEDKIDLSAEVALCHDFLHEATEQSTGIHVRRLVQLGKANEAEALLEATVVREFNWSP